MRILILGGTKFLGRHLVETALSRGHQVTLFNRGKTNPELFPEVEKLEGDRDGGLGVLRGGRWDAAVDTCGYVPRLVRASSEMLADLVGHYTFISSISVYADMSRPGVDETAPVHKLADETVEEVNGATYGGLKALCERAAETAMPDRVLNVRAGLIVGPNDPTDRFPYWPRRVALGGDVLAPGQPDRAVQFIDVRDLGAWILRQAEGGTTGAFNVTGPEQPLSMGTILDTCRRVSGSNANFIWASDSFLKANAVASYTEMPLWIPGEIAGFNAVDCRRAYACGLVTRPLADTVRDTLEWDANRTDSPGPDRRFGLPGSMKPEREQELLRLWREEGDRAAASPARSSAGSNPS